MKIITPGKQFIGVVFSSGHAAYWAIDILSEDANEETGGPHMQAQTHKHNDHKKGPVK